MYFLNYISKRHMGGHYFVEIVKISLIVEGEHNFNLIINKMTYYRENYKLYGIHILN